MYERAFKQYTCTALSITRQRELDKKKNKHYIVYTCMCSAESGGNASSCLPGGGKFNHVKSVFGWFLRGGGQKSFLYPPPRQQPPSHPSIPSSRSPYVSRVLWRLTRVGPLNEPYLRQTNPIQLRVPDNIHRDAFMAVNFAFLRYTRKHSHTYYIV